jgi:hypothetical protein
MWVVIHDYDLKCFCGQRPRLFVNNEKYHFSCGDHSGPAGESTVEKAAESWAERQEILSKEL